MRINISIPKESLELIDQWCFATGMKRSTFLTRSALKEIGVHGKDYSELLPVHEKIKESVIDPFDLVTEPKKK